MLAHTRLAAAAFSLAALFAGPALASSHIEYSTPKPKETLTKAPAAIILSFSQNIDPTASSIKVYNAAGKMINNGMAVGNPHTPRVISTASLPANMPKGEYTVQWKAVCNCAGHSTTKEAFVFFIK